MKPLCNRVTAIHEAGHAVIATALGLPWEHCWARASEGKLHLRSEMGPVWESFNGAVATLAGPVAQVRFNKRGWERNLWGGIENDIRQAERCIEPENIIRAWSIARKLVRVHWRDIQAMADNLQHATVWNMNAPTSLTINFIDRGAK